MNDQCKYCIHKNVCAYKAHYEDVVELYKKAREECGKYPYFKCSVTCVQYQKDTLNLRGIQNMGGSEE